MTENKSVKNPKWFTLRIDELAALGDGFTMGVSCDGHDTEPPADTYILMEYWRVNASEPSNVVHFKGLWQAWISCTNTHMKAIAGAPDGSDPLGECVLKALGSIVRFNYPSMEESMADLDLYLENQPTAAAGH